MKTALMALTLLWAIPAHGDSLNCSADLIKMSDLKVEVLTPCSHEGCKRYRIVGKLINGCQIAVSPKVQIVALDSSGQVFDTKELWPSSINNINPGDSRPFSVGSIFRYDSRISEFSIEVIGVNHF